MPLSIAPAIPGVTASSASNPDALPRPDTLRTPQADLAPTDTAGGSSAGMARLNKRLKELTEQLQRLQQQLQEAISRAASNPGQAGAVLGLQGEIASTLAALQQLVGEMFKQSSVTPPSGTLSVQA